MHSSSLIKYALAVFLGVNLFSLTGCGRRGGLELPPGAQETPEGNAALRAVNPQSTAVNSSVFPPASQAAPTFHTSSTSSGSATPEAETSDAAAASPQPSAESGAASLPANALKPARPRTPFVLDPLL